MKREWIVVERHGSTPSCTQLNGVVFERNDGMTSYTQLPAKDAFRLFCKIVAAGGNAVCKNFIGGVK